MIKEYVTWLAGRTTPPLTIGANIFAGPWPETAADLCTAVLEGPAPQNAYLPKERQVRLQFLTRGPTYQSARTEAWRIFDAAANATGFPLGNGWRLHGTPQLNGPQWIGFDPRGRFEFSANLTLQVRRPT